MLLLGIWVGAGHPHMQCFLTPLVQKLHQLESMPTPAKGKKGPLLIQVVVLTTVMDLRGKVCDLKQKTSF